MLNTLLLSAPSALGGTVDKLRTDWIAPIFLIVLIVLVLKFMFQRQWIAFFAFVCFAMVVGIIIFRTTDFFGESGALTNTGTDFGHSAFNAIGTVFTGLGGVVTNAVPVVGSLIGLG